MSRDWTPEQFDIIIKSHNMPKQSQIIMKREVDGKMVQVQPDDLIQFLQSYDRLGTFGADVLTQCYYAGMHETQNGCDLLKQVEDYFSGVDISDKELASKAQLWYTGQLVPGYYLDENNEAFADFLIAKNLLREIEDLSSNFIVE